MSENIITRLDDLHSILQYCSDKQKVGKPECFTALERICINQERGALLSQCNEENRQHEIRFYSCPPKLESKIRFILQKVIDNNLITQ